MHVNSLIEASICNYLCRFGTHRNACSTCILVTHKIKSTQTFPVQ